MLRRSRRDIASKLKKHFESIVSGVPAGQVFVDFFRRLPDGFRLRAVLPAAAARGTGQAANPFFSTRFSNWGKQTMRKLLRNKKGQSLVEYGILVGGIALVALAATAILGHKTTDLIATTAAALPGAHADDAGPIVSGKLVATTTQSGGSGLILDATSTGTIEDNLGISNISQLVLEASEDDD